MSTSVLNIAERKGAKRYKYRAEAQYEIHRFHLRLHEHIFSTSPKKASDGLLHYSVIRDIRVRDPYPGLDSEITIETTLPLRTLIALANDIEDCHVIAETLQPETLYTGERKQTR